MRPFRTGWQKGLGAGFRYDWTQYPVMRGREWAVGPFLSYCRRSSCASAWATSTPSGPPRDGFTDNESSARKVDEILFQATFILGAHPSHPF